MPSIHRFQARGRVKFSRVLILSAFLAHRVCAVPHAETSCGILSSDYLLSEASRESEFYFQKWLERNRLTESTSVGNREARFREFLAAERQALRDVRTLLVETYRQRIEGLRSKVAPGDTIAFLDKQYVVVAKLGQNMEGQVALVEDGGGLVVIKKFYFEKDFRDALTSLDFLLQRGVSVARVLAQEPSTLSLKMSYEPGVTGSDIMHLIIDGKLPNHFSFTYGQVYHEVIGRIERQYGAELGRLTGNPTYFRPNLGNVSYNPHTETFTIFDPH
jgi:hypothetical protein